MRNLTKLLYTALILLLINKFVPGITVEGIYIAIMVAIVLGILNFFIRPVLVVLTLPINIITLGLFTIIINASLFYFTSSFIKGFSVESFMYAVLGSLIISVADNVGKRIVY